MNVKPTWKQDPDSTTEEPEEKILCAACNAPITSPLYELAMSGAHTHHFTNPAGVEFHIGCFSQAPGASHHGTPTTYFTWFPGYGWQMATCRSCQQHVGWRFSADDQFYGLILDRLTS